MSTNITDTIITSNLVVTILFILPGFLAEDELRRRFPFKHRTVFEKTVYSIYYSVGIHLFLLVLITFYVCIVTRQPPWIKQPYIITVDKISTYPLMYFYCISAIAAGRLFGKIIVYYFIRWDRKNLTLPLWYSVFPDNKITFVRIKLKDGRVYTGQIQHIPSDYDILSGSEKDIYIVYPYLRHANSWEDLTEKGIDGILLNTRDIMSMELAFRDEQK